MPWRRLAVRARSQWRYLLSDLRALVKEELPLWVQALRTLLGVLLALDIAFRLDLSSPASAAVTVVVVSLPQSGMVLEKSFYRLLATVTSALVTLFIVVLLAQQRDLFILVVALWLGICAALSLRFRNFQSYGWALAGYTTCLIGFPAYMNPEHAFDIAVDRVSIVALGVLCGGLVNAIVFPQLTTLSLVQTVRRSFIDFTEFVTNTLQGYRSAFDLHAKQRQFLHDLVALESARSSSYFENPETRIRSPRLRRFISQFMLVSTTAHAINRMRTNLVAAHKQPVLVALEPLHEQFLLALQTREHQAPTMAVEAVVVVEQLSHLLEQWPKLCAEAHARLALDTAELRIELDSALVMLHEFVEEAFTLARVYAELRSARSEFDRHEPTFSAGAASNTMSVIAGLRTVLAFLAVCAFWISSSWADGLPAALLSAVACTLFVNVPDPARSVRQMTIGFMLGFVSSALCFTFVLPLLDGMVLLAAGLAPFLLIGTYLLARRDTAGIGSGYCMMFLVSIALTSEMHYDVIALLNGGLAQIVGVLVAALAFTIIFPTNTEWHARRIERRMWRELHTVYKAPLGSARHRFESSVRDLGLQWINLATTDNQRQHRLIVCMVVLEAGRALWTLRDMSERDPPHAFTRPVVALIQTALDVLTGATTLERLNELDQRCSQLMRDMEVIYGEANAAPIALYAALAMLQLAVVEYIQLAEFKHTAFVEVEVDHAARA